jgi:hypothetical protein
MLEHRVKARRVKGSLQGVGHLDPGGDRRRRAGKRRRGGDDGAEDEGDEGWRRGHGGGAGSDGSDEEWQYGGDDDEGGGDGGDAMAGIVGDTDWRERAARARVEQRRRVARERKRNGADM